MQPVGTAFLHGHTCPQQLCALAKGLCPWDNSPWAPSLGLVQALDLQWAGI